MRIIDPRRWARAEHYAFFRSLEYPYLAVTAEVEVGQALARAREQSISIFAAMLHAVVGAANDVAALRQRIRITEAEEQVVEHERVHAGFTAAAEGDLFTYTWAPWSPDLPEFARAVREASERAADRSSLGPFDSHRDDLFFCSCLPWVRFTEVTHPMPTARVDSVPRIAWGRIGRDGESERMPVNIQAHHALVDGRHLGSFYESLQARLDTPPA